MEGILAPAAAGSSYEPMKSKFFLIMSLLLCISVMGCSHPESLGTLTPIAGNDLEDVYREIAPDPGDLAPSTAVSPAQIDNGDAAGWEYFWEEDVTAHVELKTYEDGVLTDTVTVLPGSEGISGTVLFGASVTDGGYLWATDLSDSSGLQSHAYTYRTDALSEPRRLSAGTTAPEPGQEVWLAALLYDLEPENRPTDIVRVQEEGLSSVPLAAVLSVTFDTDMEN